MAISKGVLHLHGHPLAIVDLCPQNTLCRLACLKTRALRKRVQAAASRARMDPHGATPVGIRSRASEAC